MALLGVMMFLILVYGCTDSYAENYNPDATSDDGSCSGFLENGEYSLSFDGVKMIMLILEILMLLVLIIL